jgi:RNA polymerase sigma-70 factor (ECF subfamily)
LTDKETTWESRLERVGKQQDKEAFVELFEHFSPQLKAFLLNGGTTPDKAEELVQETMIKVWQKAPGFDASIAAASTWIYTIARNTRIDWLRKRSRQDPAKLTAEDVYNDREEPTPYSSLVQNRSRRQVADQMKLLPSDQLSVLHLMYFQGKSGQQVADELGLPLGTVKSRIRLALNKMRIAMVDNGAGVEKAFGEPS